MDALFRRPGWALTAALIFAATIGPRETLATGTARIQQPDNTVRMYYNVRILVRDETMWMTSSDGIGTIVIGKAACTKIGELVRCLPYDATLVQRGQTVHIQLKSGTVWVNPSATNQQLPRSSTQIPPHGVSLAAETARGTFVTLTGTIDQVNK